MSATADNARLCHGCDQQFSALLPSMALVCGHLLCQSCVTREELCLQCYACAGRGVPIAVDTSIMDKYIVETDGAGGLSATQPTPTQLCEMCDPGFEEPALFACAEMGKRALCGDHAGVYSSHGKTTTELRAFSDAPNQCARHAAACFFFCTVCTVPVCSDCVDEPKHAGHATVSRKAAPPLLREDLSTFVEALGDTQALLAAALDNNTRARESVATKEKAAIAEAKRVFKALHAQLVEREAEVIRQITEAAQEKDVAYGREDFHLRSTIAELQLGRDMGTKAATVENVACMAQTRGVLQWMEEGLRVPAVPGLPQPDVLFVDFPSLGSMQAEVDRVGTVHDQ